MFHFILYRLICLVSTIFVIVLFCNLFTEASCIARKHSYNGEWQRAFETWISTIKDWCMGWFYWNMGPSKTFARYISNIVYITKIFKTSPVHAYIHCESKKHHTLVHNLMGHYLVMFIFNPITNRSFQLWNSLNRHPHFLLFSYLLVTSHSSPSLLCSDPKCAVRLSRDVLHSCLKTYHFSKFFSLSVPLCHAPISQNIYQLVFGSLWQW